MNENLKRPRWGMANFERRRHPRFVINLPVLYQRLDQNPNSGRTGDLSEGGLLLYISHEVKVGEDLRVTLFVDSGTGLQPFEVKARVIWQDFRFGTEEYRVGVHFLDITQEQLETLKDFMKNIAEKEMVR